MITLRLIITIIVMGVLLFGFSIFCAYVFSKNKKDKKRLIKETQRSRVMKWIKKLWTTPLTAGSFIVFLFVSDYLIRPFWQAFVNWIILNWLGIK